MRGIIILASASLLVTSSIAAAQGNNPGQELARPGTDADTRYITDVAGKRVRLIGRRFLSDPRKKLCFPGRGCAEAETTSSN